jgi:sulfatase maturation enzyme AslB (radical SAM superfamily)
VIASIVHAIVTYIVHVIVTHIVLVITNVPQRLKLVTCMMDGNMKNCQGCLRYDPTHCAGLCNIYNTNKHHIIITINISKKCNLNCTFCYNKYISDKPDITIDTLTKLFDYLETFNQTSFSFYLLGGEPCLYPDIINFIAEESLQRFGLLDMRIYTNGYCNIEVMNQLANKYKNISFIVSKNYKFRLNYNLNLFA